MIELLKLLFHAPVEKEESWTDWWVKVAPSAEHVTPLLETLVWVALIVYLAKKFKVPLTRLFEILGKRIQDGAGIKLWQMELGSSVQSTDEQRAKIAQDALDKSSAKDGSEDEESEGQKVAVAEKGKQEDSGGRSKGKQKNVGGQTYLLAEDLAMRALQSEFSVGILRQAKLGPNLLADGLMQYNGGRAVIEVKFSTHRPRPGQIKFHLAQLSVLGTRLREHFPKDEITEAIVYVVQNISDVLETKELIEKEILEYNRLHGVQGKFSIARVYSLDELLSRFGVR